MLHTTTITRMHGDVEHTYTLVADEHGQPITFADGREAAKEAGRLADQGNTTLAIAFDAIEGDYYIEIADPERFATVQEMFASVREFPMKKHN